ncbi:uncharacterized protein [Venturia canescens]|uniref:uncharacterized protein n=1 Tax=Venturia canescens TaxID=32260 RepID=UPI001C9C8AC1|nr:uncharacterized protein LOC122414718 [Venturia canescens]
MVTGVPLWLRTIFRIRESEKEIKSDVCAETSGSRVDRLFDLGDPRDCSDMKNPISSMGNITVMLERLLMFVKYFVCLSLITCAGFPVYAATNPKGDIRVDVKVPKELELGGSGNLTCEWRLMGGKNLYSVKWYKDDHEFFRYVPTNPERIQTFKQQGVQLDKKAISEKSIRLAGLTLNSTGQYKCEVSTEGPSFATEYKTGNLTVIALPERGPEITGLSSHYAVGENVTANCSAWPSVPKANLHWTINGKPVPAEYTIVHPPWQPTSSLGTPNSLGLRMDADPRHFEGGDGSVSIRCVSYVGSKRSEVEKTVHMAHVNNQRLSAGDLRGSGTSIKTAAPSNRNLLAIVLVILSFGVST